MPTYEVTSPDGKTWEVTAPDGASQEQVLAYAKQQWAAQPTKPQPAAVTAGQQIAGIPRQLGLMARYAVEGPLAVADTIASPLRYGLSKLTGRNVPTGVQMASDAMTSAGLPQPEGANERVIGDMARAVAGAGGLAGATSAASNAAVGPTVRAVLEQFAAKPGTQVIAGATGSGAGGAVREAGGGPGAQFAASLLGGLAGGAAATKAQQVGQGLASRARALVTPVPSQAIEQRIEMALQGSPTPWGTLPTSARAAMRTEVEDALRAGMPLNQDAIRRLAAFRAVPGTTPTRGMLTQDPVHITRERNLAKTGANSSDMGLQRLPRVENENTAALLRALDDAGAGTAPDQFATGQRLIGALGENIKASKARIDSLYDAARDTSGRSAPLDGAAFTRRAGELLDEGMLGGALPKSVETHLNRIAMGEVPFDVAYAEQLKTAIGKLQRGTTDGQARMALGVVRKALDDTPLRAAPQVNPGNLPAVPGTVPPSPAALGAESIQAFNRARTENRAFMQRVENTPALKAVIDGVEPDRFVQQFVTGQGATVSDVRALSRAVAGNAEALQAVRGSIVAHLRNAATNGTQDVTKFSSSAYARALDNIGDRKLAAFFAPEEIAQLRAIGRVGTYMQAQPAGAAVNNSNSGALVLGRGLDWLTDRTPLIAPLLQGTIRGVQQGRALNVPGALMAPRVQPAGLLDGVAAPLPLLSGGLLAIPQPPDKRQDQQ